MGLESDHEKQGNTHLRSDSVSSSFECQVHLFTLFNYNTTTIKDKKEVKNRADDTLS